MGAKQVGLALILGLVNGIVGCAGKSRSEAGSDRSGNGGASGAGPSGTGGTMPATGSGGTTSSEGGSTPDEVGGSDFGGAGFGASPPASGGSGDPSPGGAGFGGAGFGGAGFGGAGFGGAGSGGAGSGGRGCADSSTAGADGCIRYCEPGAGGASDLVEGYILDSSDVPVETSFDASVTVVEAQTSERLIIEAEDQQRWTLGLRIPGLPAEISQVGTAFDISVVAERSGLLIDPRIHQQIALLRAGEVLAFVGLNGTGLSMTASSNRCLESDGICARVRLSWFVSAGEESIVLFPHETREIGSYSVTLDESFSYLSDGFCDLVGTTEIAGVALD